MSPDAGIPLPEPTELTQPFWDGCARGELLYQSCDDCGGITFIPQPACSKCLSPKVRWAKSAGKGTVYSYTVVWRPQTPAFEVPYVVAIIDLVEGHQMMSNVVGCDHDQVSVGMPVEVEFRRMSDAITLPYFKPTER